MNIKVKYMLWLREKIGLEQEEFKLDRETSLEDLVRIIILKHREAEKYLSNIFSDDNPFIILVNGIPRKKNYILKDNDLVTILPPVSGG
ncbi:MoaD/ThiS family protein [Staphylothermus hellenicus]|uniref:ThiamineS protein n=1 Tax=Staphylothermus hellenicus (strain DSM 12710 / JCM 10830 / BK20S6-10-b1 / P8) TaxID=591019 RepID=D7DBH0_STAHD|nr:MoaD/ThiS family protein [Staphylothermus hellenicus]ADI31517.1 thiamineS protein [Staphylothermus hellenicus DSM 12710]